VKGEEILVAIKAAATAAREALEPISMGLGFGQVTQVRTFGEGGFDVLTQDVAEAAEIAKKKGLSAGVLAFLVSLILSFLI
jgi:predicted neutral ceramidase superfamily lipid hydrolase